MKKVSKAKIAATYAEALLEAVPDRKTADKVFADAERLRGAAAGELAAYMANPLWPESDKRAVLEQTADKLKLAPTTRNFLRAVAENKRFAELPEMLDSFVHAYYRRLKIAEAEVESAQKLSAAQVKKLTVALEDRLAQKVAISFKVSPELIGGLRVRIGSEMFDDTLAAKLSRLEIMLKGEE